MNLTDIKRIYHLSDNDLDGVACTHLTRLAFPDKEIITKLIDRRTVDQEVMKFIQNEWDKDTCLIITDMNISQDVAVIIDDMYNIGYYARLFDHHQTASWLNKYRWAFVYPGNVEKEKESATSIYYKYLTLQNPSIQYVFLDHYTDLVRSYDTWEWEKTGNIEAKQLNDLFWLLGEEKFTSSILSKAKKTKDKLSVAFYFTDEELYLLSIENKRIQNYIKKKKEQMIIIRNGFIMDRSYVIGVVPAESYISELGNELCKDNPNIDFVAIIDFGNNKISFRTIKDDIDVSVIAKHFHGGGHQKASGCPLNQMAADFFVNTWLRQVIV